MLPKPWGCLSRHSAPFHPPMSVFWLFYPLSSLTWAMGQVTCTGKREKLIPSSSSSVINICLEMSLLISWPEALLKSSALVPKQLGSWARPGLCCLDCQILKCYEIGGWPQMQNFFIWGDSDQLIFDVQFQSFSTPLS